LNEALLNSDFSSPKSEDNILLDIEVLRIELSALIESSLNSNLSSELNNKNEFKKLRDFCLELSKSSSRYDF